MTTIKKHDFVQIEYTGKIVDSDLIFDTTNEEVAKKNDIHNSGMPYGKYIICVGEGRILKGLEDEMIDKEIGKEYNIKLDAARGFGKKDAKLLKLVPTAIFKKQGVQAQPGLQVNIDGTIGTIRTVTGGRTVVDFNHPLSGKEIQYTVKVSKIIEDDSEKISALVKMALNIKDVVVEFKDAKARIKLKDQLPKEISEIISKKISELVPSVKAIEIIKA